jgi:hypothetical protein
MEMTGTMTIVLLAGILIAAAMACRLGKRREPRAGEFAPPPSDPTRGFRDPSR